MALLVLNLGAAHDGTSQCRFCSDFTLLEAIDEWRCFYLKWSYMTGGSRPIGYFCPVLTADGKVDCAPKITLNRFQPVRS